MGNFPGIGFHKGPILTLHWVDVSRVVRAGGWLEAVGRRSRHHSSVIFRHWVMDLSGCVGKLWREELFVWQLTLDVFSLAKVSVISNFLFFDLNFQFVSITEVFESDQILLEVCLSQSLEIFGFLVFKEGDESVLKCCIGFLSGNVTCLYVTKLFEEFEEILLVGIQRKITDVNFLVELLSVISQFLVTFEERSDLDDGGANSRHSDAKHSLVGSSVIGFNDVVTLGGIRLFLGNFDFEALSGKEVNDVLLSDF